MFFLFFSVSSFEKKIGFLHLSVAKSSTTVWLGGPSPSRFVAIAAERTVAEDKERLTPAEMADGEETWCLSL